MFFDEKNSVTEEISIAISIKLRDQSPQFCVKVPADVTEEDFYEKIKEKLGKRLKDDQKLIISVGNWICNEKGIHPVYTQMIATQCFINDHIVDKSNWYNLRIQGKVVSIEPKESYNKCCNIM